MTKADEYDLAWQAIGSDSGWKPVEEGEIWHASDRAIRLRLDKVLKDKSVLHTNLGFCLSEYEREPLTLRLFDGFITLKRWRLGLLEALFSQRVRRLRKRALFLLGSVTRQRGPTVEERCQEALKILRRSRVL